MLTRLVQFHILLIITLLASCSDRVDTIRNTEPEVQKIQDVGTTQSVDVRPAKSDECSQGGIVYTMYLDTNVNSVFDEDETVLKKYPVCNGNNGANGSNGQNGHGVAFQVIASTQEICPNGGSTIMMATDINNTGVYNSQFPNQQSMTICNGQNGVTPAFTTVETITACGNNVAYKEVLLRLQNGQVLASFSNDTGGTMTRLSFLPDGTFMNTDNSGCVFSLSTSSDGKTRSISWSGQIQQSWPMSN